ncbi:outer membrane protein, multidrug efflux system/outer membrane protein, multidrug efflux system [Acinetobacter marinus]|uniref:Outer membrane protein, multidrug efflux system/outer membrane protein, multidrug efflux system n=1 Tax=Acinetobacter marinus TaxID=281375 RepID=A0A1G6HP89_9GAMM|nr:AdeC/AdeK/OprM family multidrug efflux complex outer membrane factor [Acinetobacter marinus]SDB95963.1 outer membrane protein, multidrug efflux system/outer membrane protein, multidrug efflux system [Acinetobacter marinus]
MSNIKATIVTGAGRGFALTVLALSLAACQSMKPAVPEAQPSIPTEYTALAQDGSPSIASQGYQEYFSDPRLEQVIALALDNNRDLRTAALNIEKTQYQYQIARNDQLPTVGATGSVVRQDTLSVTKPYTTYSVGLGVTSYELDFWGRVASLKDAALETYFATQAARDATQVSLVGQVAQAWVAISFAEQNLKLAQQTLKAQQDSYSLNKRRFDVGLDSEIPLRQSQISVETARGDVASYKTEIEQQKNALNLLVGQTVPANLLPDTAIVRITDNRALSAGLPSELLNNRPDIRSAEYQLRAAGANIGAAKARLFPTISLTGSAGYASTDMSDLFKSGSFIWSLGPSIDLPIFDWGTRRNNIKISEVDQKIALSDYEGTIQTAFREVNDVLATRANIDDRIAAQRRLVEATNKTYQLSQARYRAGLDNYLTVLDAQRTAYSAEQGLLALRQANLNSQIELYKTLGGGLTTTQAENAQVESQTTSNSTSSNN